MRGPATVGIIGNEQTGKTQHKSAGFINTKESTLAMDRLSHHRASFTITQCILLTTQ